ncbi:serine hydrolase domain-containing protein [Agromyces sp. M3QZ16-3]|uniref:serine hydrolase domain-containing protein n=1 Tax=Agromyces sp. M3QZ16-3 TaxID=3447585 RepID=UPI003F68C75E
MGRPVRFVAAIAAASVVALLVGCTIGGEPSAQPSPTPAEEAGGAAGGRTPPTIDPEVQALLDEAAAAQVDAHALGSLLGEIRVDGDVVAQVALGEAVGGEPVAIDGRFRNGAVAITYVSVAMLRLAEEGVLDLDEPIDQWLPDLRDADTVTPRMLANMTAGYHDYVGDPAFEEALAVDPFRSWTNEDLIDVSLSEPRLFPAGGNWDYSHADYVVLGEVLEAASGEPLEELIAREVLEPLGLEQTVASEEPSIPAPVVHAFTAERGVWEDSTYWNPSWTLPEGAVQTSSIGDVAASFDAIVGRGELLDAESYDALIAPELVGFGEPLDGCRACMTLIPEFSYGLGTFLSLDWVMQTPLFGGYASAVATLPAERADDGRSMTIAVAVTYTEDTFEDWDGALVNWGEDLVRRLTADLVPESPAAQPLG